MKRYRKIRMALSLATLLLITSCQMTEEEKVREISQNFADLYYNLNIRKAKHYCSSEIHTIMDFRHTNIKEKDGTLQQQAGKATAQILNCDLDIENETAYVKMAISNFLRINYLNDSLSIIPCDTIELVLTKEIDNVWRIKHPV